MSLDRIINKVINNSEGANETLLDLTEDTVNENNLLENQTAHNREGEPIRGALQVGGAVNSVNGKTGDVVLTTSDLANNSGFITITVNNLINYYLKSETYSKSEVDSIAAAIKNSRFEVVAELPTTDIQTNVIYLVPKTTAETSDIKDEYINLDGTSAGWEKIGDTNIDLSGYVTTQDLNTALADYTTTANLTLLLADKVDKVTGKGLSTEDFTTAEKTKLDNLANIKSVGTGLSLDGSTGELIATGGTGTGGHTIVDEQGNTYPARAKLKFINCDITDDSTNDTTIIEAEGGGGGTIVVVPTVTDTNPVYDGTQKSPTITRDTDHTYIQGDYEATNYGTYTFTIGLSGVNDIWTDNTTEPKTYTWSINYDGGTITPVNDIQTWLKCANIDDKAYTTLSEVLADHETLYALINNNNATDYLVRSTSWASGITADETAMEYIGHKNYASDTLLGDSTWFTAIWGSTYREEVMNAKVPTMTSDTTPYGEVFGTTAGGSTHAYNVFDNNASTYYYGNAADRYIGYKFINPVCVKRVYVNEEHLGSAATSITEAIQASNDNNTWVNLASFLVGVETINQYYDINNSDYYLYYRMKCISGVAEGSNIGTKTYELQFYGRTDITENQIDIYSAASDTVYYMDNGSPVTVCTTDTTGHGTVSKSSLPNGTYTLYSTVAKDPENLSNDYSKSVTVAFDTYEIKVMPDGALYWYGWKDEIETINSTNGWSVSPSYGVTWQIVNPIYNTNSVQGSTTAYAECCGISSISKKSVIGKKFKTIYHGPANVLYLRLWNDKSDFVNNIVVQNPNISQAVSDDTLYTFDLGTSYTSTYYVGAQNGGQGNNVIIKALWLE